MEKLIKVFAAVFSTNFTTIVQFIYEMDTLVHELLKEIGNGLDEQDIQMIVKLLKLQQRINAWRVKQIDMPIMEIKLPKEAKPDDVMGGDDAVLESMFRILFCGEGPQFKEALEKESAKLLFKQQR